MKYIVTAPSNGILRIDKGKYAPGDILALKGNFIWLGFYGLQGADDKPIIITNEGKVEIGNPTWNNGAYAQGLDLSNAKNLEIYGSSKADLVVRGPLTANRQSYHNVQMSNFTERIIMHDLTIKDGGTGISCKTDPTDDPRTWINNEPLGPFIFYNIEIYNTANEAMYIGNTATYFDLTTKQQVYISPSQFDPTHKYVEPIMLKNVSIHHVYVHDVQVDGIQTAAIRGLRVSHNEITNWGIRKDWSHNGGILIGGKVEDSEVYCNNVHDGWGEMLQVYGRGNNHKIYNNQFIGNQIDGVSFRIDGSAEFYDNTVAKTGDNNVRVYKGTLKATNNLLAQPRMKGAISDSAYVYMESGANVVEIANMKLKTYDPLVPSPVGYIKGVCKETTTPNPCPPCPDCPPIPIIPVPVAILMSDGSRYDIK